MNYSTDCRYFKGDRPCIFHKKENVRCKCRYFEPIKTKILIIKLGEIGDVIRTTPILHKLKENYPDSEVTWMTKHPEVLPSVVESRLKFNEENILILKTQSFDFLFNFDKEKESCALADLIQAKTKKGFHLVDGKCAPFDKDSEDKYAVGLDDELSKKNRKSYPEQIFEMAGYKFNNERYIFDNPYKKTKKLIGLNTGCGLRWRTRIWSEQNWVSLAKRLMEEGYNVLILGGEAEHMKNKRIAEESGAIYLGYHQVNVFVALVNLCDIVVTTITMALHIALALEKKVVVLNNVFNKNEFELYGLGKIIEPKVDCLGCYKTECEKDCIDLIKPEDVIAAIGEVQK